MKDSKAPLIPVLVMAVVLAFITKASYAQQQQGQGVALPSSPDSGPLTPADELDQLEHFMGPLSLDQERRLKELRAGANGNQTPSISGAAGRAAGAGAAGATGGVTAGARGGTPAPPPAPAAPPGYSIVFDDPILMGPPLIAPESEDQKLLASAAGSLPGGPAAPPARPPAPPAPPPAPPAVVKQNVDTQSAAAVANANYMTEVRENPELRNTWDSFINAVTKTFGGGAGHDLMEAAPSLPPAVPGGDIKAAERCPDGQLWDGAICHRDQMEIKVGGVRGEPNEL